MKVNTDSVLLGAWTQIPEIARTGLDIGTGTGILALMMAHKNEKLQIDTVEIEESAFKESRENFENSNWSKRLASHFVSLQSFEPSQKYDFIITNPPYFLNSLKNKLENKALARHTDSLSFEEIIGFCIKNLSEKGSLSLVLPKNESEIFIKLSEENSLFLNRKCNIRPNKNKEINRVMMEFSFTKNELKKDEMEVYKAQKIYSERHFELTQEYYLDKNPS